MAEPRPPVETRDVRPRALWLIGLGIGVFVALTAAGLLVFFDPDAGWASRREARPPPGLQVTPVADHEGFMAAKRAELHDRGWVDREAGLLEIPIDEAMRLVAQGHRAETEIDSAGCAGAACPEAAPSARTIP